MNNMEWIKLIDFGEYRHQKGLQIVSRYSAEKMIEYFRSLRGKFMRHFLGLPIYIGHPDDLEYTDSRDKTVYGRIENMKIEDNALWILSRWTSIGKKIFKHEFLKYLSPRWMMEKVADGIFSPVRLLSVGLTNHPNVRCAHIVHPVEDISHVADIEELSELVDNKNVTNESLCNDVENGESDESSLNAEYEIMDVNDDIKKFEATLHTSSLTDNLFTRCTEPSTKDKILKLVYNHMSLSGDNYQSAWMTVKRQNPGLFQ